MNNQPTFVGIEDAETQGVVQNRTFGVITSGSVFISNGSVQSRKPIGVASILWPSSAISAVGGIVDIPLTVIMGCVVTSSCVFVDTAVAVAVASAATTAGRCTTRSSS